MNTNIDTAEVGYLLTRLLSRQPLPERNEDRCPGNLVTDGDDRLD